LDCGEDTGRGGEFYALHDDVWFSAHSSRIGMLCVGCIEARLGRRLTANDFTASYINAPRFGAKSARLMERVAA
jgi:hypothetical protein